MRSAAEQPSLHTSEGGRHQAQLADGPRPDGVPDLVECRTPTPGVVDRQDNPVRLAGRNHAVGILDVRRKRLLAEDRPDARLRRHHRRLGVEMLRRRHRDDVELLAGQHLAVIAVQTHVGPPVVPISAEAFDPRGIQITTGDDLDLRHVAYRPGVGHHHAVAEGDELGLLGRLRRRLDNGGQVLGRQLADGDRPQPYDSQSVFLPVQLDCAPLILPSRIHYRSPSGPKSLK